jgi:hypothetical protein
MKKTVTFAILLCILTLGLQAVKLDVGIFYGSRSVNDDAIKDVYGNGSVYFPYVALNVWKGLSFGLGYEGGYSRDGKIGLYQEDSTLKVTGIEFFAAYQHSLGKFAPYLKLGYGSYSYKQAVGGTDKIDDKKSALTMAAGARFYPTEALFLAVEIKSVPLKVKPLTTEVDLGGLRLAAGIGYTFNL